MSSQNQIKCTNCGTLIDINDALSHQLEEQYKSKFTAQIQIEKKRFQEQLNQLEQEKKQLDEWKEQQQKIMDEQVNAKIKSQRSLLENELKKKLGEEQAERISAYEKELEEKAEQLKNMNKAAAENAKLKRDMEAMQVKMELELQQKLTDQINQEKDRIRKEEDERNELVIRELKLKLEEQEKLTNEMRRKQQQGSMQMQGEVQELAIEDWLKDEFPHDAIQEIKKGERGADCLQVVNSAFRQNCGSIYYESKRTKEFQSSWIEKFKEDIRQKGANIGVLVSDNYPKGMDRLGLYEGIWICSFAEFKGLSLVLRDSIIRLSEVTASNENRGDKMVMLYDFLTGNEFRLQVEAIVEGFTEMQKDLVKEKRAIEGAWKKREKQIQKVLLNTNYMYQSVRGIAGAAIAPIQLLELSEPDTEAQENEEAD
jgi:hypothetical protein